MVIKETLEQRSSRILKDLKDKYPKANAFDLDGRGLHFVCEVEPTVGHPEFDRAVEVMISTKKHKHLKTTQRYTILKGTLNLFLDGKEIILQKNDVYIVETGVIHHATSKDEAWVEIYSTPGWTKEDHILIE